MIGYAKVKCQCCSDEHEEDLMTFDPQLNGPVCEDCRRSFIKAIAYLKHEGINRPVVSTDITPWNHKRFLN